MIPVTNTITQVDELDHIEEIEFTIGDPRFVMMTQAKLYSDVTDAIIREYSTNAYDAHVMAGHRDPIEVTLPSMMSPEFVIKDHGIGMDLEDFRNIYTRFGVSNKRNSNDLNGQLGYGSKSGVAYTTSFQVTSVKNGIKNIAVVQRKPDWTIVLKVLSTQKTDEANGTEIRIPVHNHEEFVTKANKFYSMWLPGRVLVNGKAPAHRAGRKIVDNLYFADGNEWNTSYVVMGNVAYRINNPRVLFNNTKMNAINFVAYVDDFKTDDGQAPVEFTPSREDLEYTERTKRTLQAIVNQFEVEILKTAQSDIDNATSHFDAYAKYREWTSRLGSGLFADLEFGGDKFETQFKVTGKEYTVSGYRNSTHHINQFDVDKMDRTVVVTEFYVDVSSNAKAKAKDYASMKDWKCSYIIFTAQKASDIDSPWISKDHFVTWENLKAELPKAVRVPNPYSNNPNAGRIPGSFDYHTASGYHSEKEVPATTYNDGDLYYISIQDNKDVKVRQIMNLLPSMKDAVVIILGANRLAKFKRDWPKATDFLAHTRGMVVSNGPSLLSQDAKDALDISDAVERWLDVLPLAKLKDPTWASVQAKRQNKNALTKRYEENLDLARATGLWYTVKKYEPKDNHFGLLTKYPLLKEFSYYSITRGKIADELSFYLNAKHADSV